MKAQKVMKKKPTSIPIKSQPTRVVRSMPQQAGPMNQMQPTQPPMKKGGSVKKKKCCGGGHVRKGR